MLPINAIAQTLPPTLSARAGDLFCSGHAWSRFGDLVVAGGTKFDPVLQQFAADSVFVFEPTQPCAPFPATPGSSAGALYPGAVGQWTQQGTRLDSPRYYPTVITTHKQLRPTPTDQNNRVQCAVVLGGSIAVLPYNSATQATTNAVGNPTWNTIESLQLVESNPVLLTDDTVAVADVFSTTSGATGRTLWGPGNPVTTNPLLDWLLEYPRMHLMGDGNLFFAGYAANSGRVNLDGGPFPPLHTQGWDSVPWSPGVGAPAVTSPERRKDGTSVLYPNLPGFENLVIRIGGDCTANPVGPTNSVEACRATGGGAGGWFSAGVAQLVHPREHCNAVLLPDASILVIGGDNHDGPITKPELHRHGSGVWTTQPNGSTVRDYHSTAVLLPDGRVFVGGGNGRHSQPGGFDYEIFSPHYLTGTPPPTRPANVTIPTATILGAGGPSPVHRLQHGTVHTLLESFLESPPSLGYRLAKVVLMAPGSITHHSDMHQRYVECPVVPVTDTQLQFTVPSDKGAPDGFYMLFVLTNTGVPSKALWVRLVP